MAIDSLVVHVILQRIAKGHGAYTGLEAVQKAVEVSSHGYEITPKCCILCLVYTRLELSTERQV